MILKVNKGLSWFLMRATDEVLNWNSFVMLLDGGLVLDLFVSELQVTDFKQ